MLYVTVETCIKFLVCMEGGSEEPVKVKGEILVHLAYYADTFMIGIRYVEYIKK